MRGNYTARTALFLPPIAASPFPPRLRACENDAALSGPAAAVPPGPAASGGAPLRMGRRNVLPARARPLHAGAGLPATATMTMSKTAAALVLMALLGATLRPAAAEPSVRVTDLTLHLGGEPGLCRKNSGSISAGGFVISGESRCQLRLDLLARCAIDVKRFQGFCKFSPMDTALASRR